VWRGEARDPQQDRSRTHVLDYGEPQDLEEDGLGHLGPHPPLEEEREGRHEHGGDEVAVHDEDEVIHAAPEGGHGDDVHPGEADLQQHHGQVRLHVAQDLAHAHYIASQLGSISLLLGEE
jgi:hypothetical protein